LHIVHAISSFFPEYRAGTEIYVLNLCKELKKHGVQANVITTSFDQTTAYVYEGIEVHRFQVKRYPDAQEMNGLKKPFGLDSFLRLLKELNPDVIHFHTFNRAINSSHLLAAKDQGFKAVFTSHLAGLFCMKNDFSFKGKLECDGRINEYRCNSCILQARGIPSPLNDMLSVFIFGITRLPLLKNKFPALSLIKNKKQELAVLRQNADAIVVLADWFVQIYRNNDFTSYRIINQGITKYESIQIKKSIDNFVRFAYIGRLSQIKGVDLLLDAFQLIENENCSLHLVVITEDDEYCKLIRARIQNDHRIIWSENQTSNEVNSILDEVDVLCLPTQIREMAPLSILEAFSKQIPVIGADHGGIADMVKHEHNGLLFKHTSVQSLAEQLKRVINDKELINRLKKNIPSPRFFSDVAKEHIQLYQTLK